MRNNLALVGNILGVIGGFIFIILGFTWAIPAFGVFGVVWTVLLAGITLFNAYQAVQRWRKPPV